MPKQKQFDKGVVLKKAMNLFWEKGYHATSMQNLVDVLGINRASLYATFDNKEELFISALRQYKEEASTYRKDFKQKIASKGARSFLKSFFEAELRSMEKDKAKRGCFIVNSMTEFGIREGDVSSMLQGNSEDFLGWFVEVIALGQQRKEIDLSYTSEELGYHLFSFFCGLKVISKFEKNHYRLRRTVDRELDWIFGEE